MGHYSQLEDACDPLEVAGGTALHLLWAGVCGVHRGGGLAQPGAPRNPQILVSRSGGPRDYLAPAPGTGPAPTHILQGLPELEAEPRL